MYDGLVGHLAPPISETIMIRPLNPRSKLFPVIDAKPGDDDYPISLSEYERWILRQRLPASGWGTCMVTTKKASKALRMLVKKGVLESDNGMFRITEAGHQAIGHGRI